MRKVQSGGQKLPRQASQWTAGLPKNQVLRLETRVR